MARSLDDVVGGKETKAEAPAEPKVEESKPELEVEAKPETEAPKAEKPRDEQGKFKKGDEVAATPAAKTSKVDEPSDPETGLKAGITAERKKRQEAEKRAQELERRLQSLEQPAKVPDVLGDPQGYAQHVKSEVEAALLDERINLSVDFARDRHQDFADVMGPDMEIWKEAVSNDPTLYQRAVSQRNPGEWAYQYLKREKMLSEIGDPENWKKQQMDALRKELEPTIRKELEAKMPQPVVPPPSLASATSGGRINTDPNGVDRKPFDKIFPLN